MWQIPTWNVLWFMHAMMAGTPPASATARMQGPDPEHTFPIARSDGVAIARSGWLWGGREGGGTGYWSEALKGRHDHSQGRAAAGQGGRAAVAAGGHGGGDK